MTGAPAPGGAAPGAAPPGAPPGPWIVSPRFDLALLAAPALATAVAFALPNPRDGVPLWAFLLLVVAFDVAHVWATLYLGYLDPEERARRRLLLFLPLPLVFLAAFRLHQHSPPLYWTVLAYVAIHHFAAQQWGFVALYRLRAGDRDPFDRGLDKLALWTGALGPVLWWHTRPEAGFDWFGHGEHFLFELPPALRKDIAAVMLGVAVAWLARQAALLRLGRLAPGKVLWMVAAWASWGLGVAWIDHPLVALACINLLHGIPFLALVWRRVNHRWEGADEDPGAPRALAWLAQRRRWLAFYGLLLALGLGEEALWDGLVWHRYGLLGVEVQFAGALESAVVALLALPQTAHYLLDGFLWRLDGSNPDLEAALGLPPRGAPRA